MEDPSNPLYQLLRIGKTEQVINQDLVGNLIAACAKLIQLNNEEIRYETFLHPSKKTVTYTILFDEHFTDFSLFSGTMRQLDTLWNRWTHIGLALSDLQIWREHNREERDAFNFIWNKVRKHFKKDSSIDAIFNQAEIEYAEKEKYNQAMMTTLNLYCDKASDYSSTMNSVRDMLQELKEKPIRSVRTPQELKIMEVIIEQLHPLSHSNAWLTYYQRRKNRTSQSALNLSENVLEKNSSLSSVASKMLINSGSDEEKQSSGKTSSSSSFYFCLHRDFEGFALHFSVVVHGSESKSFFAFTTIEKEFSNVEREFQFSGDSPQCSEDLRRIPS